MAAFPVTTLGTDAMHGYTPASTTVFTVAKDINLKHSQVLRWLKATVDVTGSAGTDTTAGYFFVILSGAREYPVTNTVAATTV
jgi:hypothetical protein